MHRNLHGLASAVWRGGSLLLVWLAVLGGCAWWSNHAVPELIGLDRDQLVQQFGAPVEEQPLPDGGRRLVFLQRITRRPSGTQVAGTTMVCRLVVETGASGIVLQAVRTGC
ncbi:MAG: hypothetical protein D6690_03035 [Nitrospirae bacterium]|nr:MAG: hypothetical protein D6690_03035 [Nitrospirota bacterium]